MNYRKVSDKISSMLNMELYKDAAEIIPEIKDKFEFIEQISKFANDFKLNQAWKCIADGKNEEESINVLYNYVSNQERAFYISDAFKKIILSNSKISSAIMAYMIGEIISNGRDFTQIDALLYDTLSQMTDFDIKNFVFIMENMVGSVVGEDIIDITKASEEKRGEYLLTVDLCVKCRIFSQQSNVFNEKTSILYNGLHEKITNYARLLLEYIRKVRQLLGYD